MFQNSFFKNIFYITRLGCETFGGPKVLLRDGTVGTIIFLLSTFGVDNLFLSLLKEYCFIFVARGDQIRWRLAGDIGISPGDNETLFNYSDGFYLCFVAI